MKRCCRTGCTRKATRIPKVCVPAIGWDRGTHEPISMYLTAHFCKDHMEAMDVSDFLVEDTKAVILAASNSQKKVPPDFGRAWFEPVRMDSVEYLEVERARAGGAKH